MRLKITIPRAILAVITFSILYFSHVYVIDTTYPNVQSFLFWEAGTGIYAMLMTCVTFGALASMLLVMRRFLTTNNGLLLLTIVVIALPVLLNWFGSFFPTVVYQIVHFAYLLVFGLYGVIPGVLYIILRAAGLANNTAAIVAAIAAIAYGIMTESVIALVRAVLPQGAKARSSKQSTSDDEVIDHDYGIRYDGSIRFDGGYERKEKDSVGDDCWHCLRFFPDGTVVGIAQTRPCSEVGLPPKDWDDCGTYRLGDRKIAFTLTSQYGSADYSGEVCNNETLMLDSFSHVNGYSAKKQVYLFVRRP